MRNLKTILAEAWDNLVRTINSETTRKLSSSDNKDRSFTYYLRATPSGSLSLVSHNSGFLQYGMYSYIRPIHIPLEYPVHLRNYSPEEAQDKIRRFDKGELLNRLFLDIRVTDPHLEQIIDLECKHGFENVMPRQQTVPQQSPAPHA